jgi:hypothetical protein
VAVVAPRPVAPVPVPRHERVDGLRAADAPVAPGEARVPRFVHEAEPRVAGEERVVPRAVHDREVALVAAVRADAREVHVADAPLAAERAEEPRVAAREVQPEDARADEEEGARVHIDAPRLDGAERDMPRAAEPQPEDMERPALAPPPRKKLAPPRAPPPRAPPPPPRAPPPRAPCAGASDASAPQTMKAMSVRRALMTASSARSGCTQYTARSRRSRTHETRVFPLAKRAPVSPPHDT